MVRDDNRYTMIIATRLEEDARMNGEGDREEIGQCKNEY